MRFFINFTLILIMVFQAAAQPKGVASIVSPDRKQLPVVRITGVRFSYPIVQHWIDRFNKTYPDIQVIIESRGTSDPSQSDILVEAYEQPESIRQEREYVYIARYAVLPIASSRSSFARTYGERGLNRELITQIFFYDPYADKDAMQDVKAPYTVYTRLQKAGVPIAFSNYFGYEQKDIKGKSIAGSDEHLIKALLRDTTGISYSPVPNIYDHITQRPLDGISVIPVDLNANKKVSDDERFYDNLSVVTRRFESNAASEMNNVPIADLHFSVNSKNASNEAITFLRWLIDESESDLHVYGYLKPEPGKKDKAKFEQFAAKHIKQ
jgi:phosphate transport system substrate-binding protein